MNTEKIVLEKETTSYWERLQTHPGMAPAILFSLAGLSVGLLREDGNWWMGLIASVVWIPVLLTARR